MSRLPSSAFILLLIVTLLGTTFASVFLFRTTEQMALDAGATGISLPSVSDLIAITGVRREGSSSGDAAAEPQDSGVNDGQNAADPPVATAVGSTGTAVPIITVRNEDSLPSWQDANRITILLMGIDERTEVSQIPSPNTDSMILVTVDPVSKRAAVLSLPRDLWVTIPGFANGRINTAYKLGVNSNYPGGGPGLAKDTVSRNLGLEVNFHVRINFVAFEEAVDALFPAGVQLCLEQEIHDPDYPDAGYGIIDVYFPAGCQRLDGVRLLQYARTRATYDGDFGRSARQQLVLQAVQSEIQSIGSVVQLLTQLPFLWSQLALHFDTNLTYEEILSLVRLVGEISTEDVNYEVIDQRYVEFATTTSGEQVLLPRQNDLSQLTYDLLNPREVYEIEELRTQANAEAARVTLLNGAGIEGLAASLSDFLRPLGLNIHSIGNAARQDQERTMIYHRGNALWTARYIAAQFSWGDERIVIESGNDTEAELTVVAGADMYNILIQLQDDAAEE